MSDEELRHLERAARYEGAVADLLACLREGHVPLSLPRQEGVPGPVLDFIRYDYNFAGIRLWMRFCTRCHAAYWGEDSIEKVVALAPMQAAAAQALALDVTAAAMDANAPGSGAPIRQAAEAMRHAFRVPLTADELERAGLRVPEDE